MLNIRTFQPGDSIPVRQLFTSGQLDFSTGTEFEEEVRAYIRRSL